MIKKIVTNKKSVSPLIAVVLVIAFTVAFTACEGEKKAGAEEKVFVFK